MSRRRPEPDEDFDRDLRACDCCDREVGSNEITHFDREDLIGGPCIALCVDCQEEFEDDTSAFQITCDRLTPEQWECLVKWIREDRGEPQWDPSGQTTVATIPDPKVSYSPEDLDQIAKVADLPFPWSIEYPGFVCVRFPTGHELNFGDVNTTWSSDLCTPSPECDNLTGFGSNLPTREIEGEKDLEEVAAILRLHVLRGWRELQNRNLVHRDIIDSFANFTL